MSLGHACPFQFRQFRQIFGRAHVGPNQAAVFARGVGGNANLVSETVLLRLVGHVHACAVYVKFPAVVHASDAALFVSSPKQAGATMRTPLVHEPDVSIRIAKCNQVFTEHANPNGRAIGSRHLGG